MSIAIITGASSGLGACYVDAVTKLFPEIDELWLIARREERLKKVAEKYPDKHTILIPMDMADMNSFKTLEKKLKTNNPQIKVLINDAGMSIGSPFEDMEFESMLKIIDLNCKGATAITKICLPYIMYGGTILEVSSTSAFVPNTNLIVYCSSKSYVSALSLVGNECLKGFICSELIRLTNYIPSAITPALNQTKPPKSTPKHNSSERLGRFFS